MKRKNLVCMLAIIVFAAAGCNSKKETSTTEVATAPVNEVATKSATEGTSATIAATDVPDTIRASFTRKYPKADKVVWVSYTPIESDELEMDDKYYYVRYNNDGSDYVSWYNNRGVWVKTSTKLANNSGLPDAVNKAINDMYPGYSIVEVDRENDKDMEMYEVELKKGDSKVKLKLLPNGEVFKRKVK